MDLNVDLLWRSILELTSQALDSDWYVLLLPVDPIREPFVDRAELATAKDLLNLEQGSVELHLLKDWFYFRVKSLRDIVGI